MTDDLAMKALSGAPADLARQALAAGCDVALVLQRRFRADRRAADALPAADRRGTPRALHAARALAARRRLPLDAAALAAERDRLLA